MSFRVHLFLVLLSAGCADATGNGCVRDSDCPAGFGCSDGRCLPRMADGAPPPQADLSTPDLGMDQLVWPDGTGSDGMCVVNNDGKIARDEMTIAAVGSVATTTVSEKVILDLQGTTSSGQAQWDLTALNANAPGTLSVDPVPAWAAADFPDADYASELMADYGYFTETKLLGVFDLKPSAMRLTGLVSDKDSHTKVIYDTPLDMLRFPVVAGDSYTTESYGTGYTEYMVPWVYKESYAVDVLTAGKLKLLPGLTLDALLVRVRQKVTNMGWTINSTTAFMFVAECYGTVARIIAEDDADDLQAVAVERMWRLAAP